MTNDLILVIDMQNVYLPGEAWGCLNMPKATQNIKKLLDQTENDICFTQFIADEKAEGVWKEYNVVNKEINEDKWLNEIVDELKPYVEEYPIYTKSTYSSMKIKEIQKKMARKDRLVITGVVSECCVLATCLEAIDMGYKIIYLEDACAGFNEETEEAVKTIFSGLIPLHVEIMTTDSYLTQEKNK